jgi:hypothetical protein
MVTLEQTLPEIQSAVVLHAPALFSLYYMYSWVIFMSEKTTARFFSCFLLTSKEGSIFEVEDNV